MYIVSPYEKGSTIRLASSLPTAQRTLARDRFLLRTTLNKSHLSPYQVHPPHVPRSWSSGPRYSFFWGPLTICSVSSFNFFMTFKAGILELCLISDSTQVPTGQSRWNQTGLDQRTETDCNPDEGVLSDSMHYAIGSTGSFILSWIQSLAYLDHKDHPEG